MAHLVRRVSGGGWRVAVRGDLGVADLRRLERACAPALDRMPIPLEIQVESLRAVDEPARRYVGCLLRRGAALVGDSDGHWRSILDADW